MEGTASRRVRVDMIDPVTGKRRQPQRTYKTKREAEAGLAQWLVEIERGTAVNASKMTVAELLRDWLGTYAQHHVRPTTLDDYERAAAVECLAGQLVTRFGAPDLATARRAAAEEFAFAASLTDHPPDTLVAMHRVFADGAIRETFRTLKARGGPKPLRAFSFLEVEEEEPPPADQLDLLALARKDSR